MKIPIIVDLEIPCFFYKEYLNFIEKYKSNIYLKKNITFDGNRKKCKFEIDIESGINELEIDIFNVNKGSIDLITPSNYKIKGIKKESNKYFVRETCIDTNYIKEENLNITLKSSKDIEEGKWKFIFDNTSLKSINLEIYLKVKNMESLKSLSKNDFNRHIAIFNGFNDLKSINIVRDFNAIDPDKYIPLFNIYFNENLEKELENFQNIVKLYKISNDFGVVYIDQNNIEMFSELYRLDGINYIERYTKMSQLATINRGIQNGIVATEEIGSNYFKTNPNISVTGSGVLIGIANSGIDYLHPDFIYPDGTSKIRYLWDQTKDGSPPEKFNIGTEYTREDINKAIKEKNTNLSVDEEGVGTALSGLCAGLGNVKNEFSGVAEESELIIVKLKKINGFYNSATLEAAINYMYKKSKEENIPLVNNITLGSNQSVAIGTTIVENDNFYDYGICDVVGAGNEGKGTTHSTGSIEFKGDIKDIEIELDEDEDELEMDLWVNKPDKSNVLIISPSGEESKLSSVSNYSVMDGLFDLEGTRYSIWSIYPMPYGGQQQTIIRLKNAKKGTWKIRLIGQFITNGIYNVYLPNKTLIGDKTKFRVNSPECTINFPAGYRDAISVGTYDSLNNSIWANSSRGPIIGTVARNISPDIICPGVNIIAPYPGGKYCTVTGSSVAASYTAGGIALIMQYTFVDKNYKNKSVVQKIRTFLRGGAKRDNQLKYPNNIYGYGILDIKGMFNQLK
ncbi:S8 family serine peptidase [Paraclostridium dentum]|uniref:S8 family serine peptidase n=1 Tax=Paraclostridium dentum TaxID=2662455 RepID=UPI003AFF847B